MTALLVSFVCDRCTSERAAPASRAFAVVREWDVLPLLERYLFPTRADAEHWRALHGQTGARVIEVGAHHPIVWQGPRSTMRGIDVANRLYDVVADASLASTQSHAWPLG